MYRILFTIFKMLHKMSVLGADGLHEEQTGMPHARHSRFQLAPMDPPQGRAEPHSQDGGL